MEYDMTKIQDKLKVYEAELDAAEKEMQDAVDRHLAAYEKWSAFKRFAALAEAK
jgi:hypothetical protein